MQRKRHTYHLWAVIGLLTGFLASACTAEDIADADNTEANIKPVEVSVSYDGSLSRAPGDAALSVNRILILPFRKTNESLTDDPANYVPDYSVARQLTISTFPALITMLKLQTGTTYRIIVIGYNSTDYDFNNQTAASRRFDLASSATPATLANMYLKPINQATGVPEFFSSQCTGYLNNIAVGSAFRPEQINQVTGTLKRIVSGFTLSVSNIPAYVKSVSLVARQLVSASKITDGSPLIPQSAGDGIARTFEAKVPTTGSVTFNYFLLPIPDAYKTLFYLDIAYSSYTERYTVKVEDSSGTVSNNRFIFLPNHWIKVTGNYSQIKIGFILTHNINLDDNAWDGIH